MLTIAMGESGPKRGRPPDHINRPKYRNEQIHFIGLLLLGTLTGTQAARAAGVAVSTIWHWRKKLLNDGREDTNELRAIVSRRQEILERRRNQEYVDQDY